ncbi:MAG: tRNA (adenosine(37)-N6)-threonylcarbamoyltransferase complex transferase subunit TsaD [Candidatus Nealsonbacteria bacterium]
MIILSIETSCDDTGISLIEAKNSGFKILSNILSSQVKIHQKWGGVVPGLAKREHQKNLPLILKKTLKKKIKIDLIAATVGPGLEPCLWTGLNFAKTLAKELKVPFVPVNHIEAHLLSNFIERKPKNVFPALSLIVSGGHTQLILIKKIGNYRILGETRDDAAGECLDKVAKILGLGYPGGPIISKKASEFSEKDKKYKIHFPRPMINQKNYDFSFSGLKTAVLYDFQKRSKKDRKSKEYIRSVSFEVQQAVIDVLIKKTLKASKDFKVKSVILGGGVSANSELRRQFKDKIKEELPKAGLLLPALSNCTDNAVMIGVAAFFNRNQKTKSWKGITANANLRVGK